MDARAVRENLLNSQIEPNSPFPPLILEPNRLRESVTDHLGPRLQGGV
jgi:hypothetical protein